MMSSWGRLGGEEKVYFQVIDRVRTKKKKAQDAKLEIFITLSSSSNKGIIN